MKKDVINLDAVIDRNEVPTLKFDGEVMTSVFGAKELWPSWVADMDFMASPAIIEALSRRLSHGVFGYESNTNILPAAVVEWFSRRHQWGFRADHIITTPRTLSSLAVMINLFSNAGDGVIVQPPVFYDFKMIIGANQRQLVKNPLALQKGRYQMDFDHLRTITAATENKLLILCNPHNPIGRVWSKQDLTTIADICIANDVFIITDEIHGDITFANSYTPLASVSRDAALNCASCISPIKSFNLAGVANSMIVIENDEKRSLCKAWYNRFEINKNNVFTNAAMIAAYTNGEPWLNQVTEYLAGNIEMLKSFLHQKVPRVKLIEPEGSYLLWLDFRELGLEVKQLEAFLVNDARMAVNPGHWFGREGAGFARLNIACPRSILRAALDQLESAVNKMTDQTASGN